MNRTKAIWAVLLALPFSAFLSCDSKVEQSSSKPASSGTTLELLVVIENNLWESPVGEEVQNYFGQEQDGLGQSEPMFDIRQLPPAQFNKLFQKHRNIIILKTDENTTAKTIYKKNVWSQPQFVVSMEAPNRDSLKLLLENEKKNMQEVFYKAERKRMQKAYERITQKDLANRIRNTMNISMLVPKGFYIAELKEDFLWLRREPPEMSHGILIYTEPYTDTTQFHVTNILERRDSVTKKFIPGPLDGTYMTTERLLSPFSRKTKFKDQYAIEVRGLWKTKNYQMGGPFLNITTYDDKNNRLLTMDGFVYHPNKPKRNYLMQLEAIIHSIEFLEKEKTQDTP
ncbi:MAG: DUF4837 family protein [Bacteroidales bacterium]